MATPQGFSAASMLFGGFFFQAPPNESHKRLMDSTRPNKVRPKKAQP
jgi:hypothetical protein